MGIQTEEFRRAIDLLPHMVWIASSQEDGAYCNRSWQQFTQMRPTGQRSGSWLECVHPEDRAVAASFWSQQLNAPAELQCRIRDKFGQYRWFQATITVPNDANDRCVVFTDINEHIERENALLDRVRLQGSMLDGSIDCIKIIAPDGTLRHMNKSGCTALGLPDDTPFGMSWIPLLPKEVHRRGKRALERAHNGKSARFAGHSVLPGRKAQHWDNLLTPTKDQFGNTVAVLCVSRDVTLQRQAERRLRTASETDSLTGLMNRRSFNLRLSKLLAKSRDKRKSVGLMLVDLDHFKHVNDSLGHLAGDHLLRTFAKRLGHSVPEAGFVARLGGDEFAVVVPGISDERDLLRAARAVHSQLDAPIRFGGKRINGKMSIGAAVYPRDATDMKSLMKAADTALIDMKGHGRGGVQMFDSQMSEFMERKAAELIAASEILNGKTIEAHYQPKVRLRDGSLRGFEALMRWRDPTTGEWKSPVAIAEAFKNYDLATRLADIMHDSVLTDISAWLQNGVKPLPVSINASPIEFMRDDFAERLLERMDRFEVPPSLLEVEITEHVLSDRGSAYVVRALNVLKRAGLRIALDDFGTGHSSLAHLTEYPVDCLKIDCSFVGGMMDDLSLLAIVETIGVLGTSLSIDVVAEGIETEEQRDLLLHAGCRMGQGLLFSGAVNFSRAAEMMS